MKFQCARDQVPPQHKIFARTQTHVTNWQDEIFHSLHLRIVSPDLLHYFSAIMTSIYLIG